MKAVVALADLYLLIGVALGAYVVRCRPDLYVIEVSTPDEKTTRQIYRLLVLFVFCSTILVWPALVRDLRGGRD